MTSGSTMFGYLICVILCWIPYSIQFTDLPATCDCNQLGQTQGLACHCMSLSGGFPVGFPIKITKMTFSGCSFFEIPKDAFDGLDLIREVHFISSRITTIQSYAFSSLHNIDIITFEGQRWGDDSALITNIDSYAFNNLHFTGGTTGGVKNGISFRNIKIGTVKERAFYEIDGLTELVIEGTEVGTVRDEAFHTVQNIVTFKMSHVTITNVVFMPFQTPVSFVNFQMVQVVTPVLSPFMVPSETTTLLMSGNTFDTVQCGLFVDGVPASNRWEHNKVICDCRLEWMFDDSGRVPGEVHESFTCKGPESVEGMSLDEFASGEETLPCSGVIRIANCAIYDGTSSSNTLAIVLPIVIILLVIAVGVGAFLLIRRKKRSEKRTANRLPPSLNDVDRKIPTSNVTPELPPRTLMPSSYDNDPAGRPLSEGTYDQLDEYDMKEPARNTDAVKMNKDLNAGYLALMDEHEFKMKHVKGPSYT